MRYVEKTAEPPLLSRWKKENEETRELLVFRNLPGEAKVEIREKLLKEQGFLCAYLMKGIDGWGSCHIEHIYPQARYPDRSTDYRNMVLCFPSTADGVNCDFGALHKAGADVTPDSFVSPLNRSCETRLKFSISGEVHPRDNEDSAAKRTIDLLALNHPILVQERIAALGGQGLGRHPYKPISASTARRLARTITGSDNQGRVAPFCIAIKQVSERYAKQCEDRASRLARKKGA